MTNECECQYGQNEILYTADGYRACLGKRCVKCGEWSVSQINPGGHFGKKYTRVSTEIKPRKECE